MGLKYNDYSSIEETGLLNISKIQFGTYTSSTSLSSGSNTSASLVTTYTSTDEYPDYVFVSSSSNTKYLILSTYTTTFPTSSSTTTYGIMLNMYNAGSSSITVGTISYVFIWV